jgi:nucleotide-binding universal stress UspA family protein
MSKGASNTLKRILVPLDGSKRAEQALPVAARLARASGGAIVLLQAVTVPTAYQQSIQETSMAIPYALSPAVPPAVEWDARYTALDAAQRYLDMTAKSGELADIEVETQALLGTAASDILVAAQSLHADLIVMCSHGYTGIKRWRLGSIAQKVARHSPVPVLVLYEDGGVPTNLHPGGIRPVRVLVALDGSSLAEATLMPAAQLCAALSAPAQGALHLVRVLTMPTMYEYGQIDSLSVARDRAIAEANVYLRTVEQRLREGDMVNLNLLVASSIVVNTDEASVLIGVAENGEYLQDAAGFEGCDVIALATHGRGGIKRWMMGSVTERILGATRLPLLIVRPQNIVIPEETESSATKLPLLVVRPQPKET